MRAELRFHRLAEHASFVFLGVVRKAAAGEGVVRVTEALEAPAVLGSLVGVDVSVRWKGAVPKTGASAIFFTHALSYGDHLALLEIGRVRPEDKAAIDAALEVRRNRPLRTRIDQSDLVVAGVAEEIRPPSDPPKSFDDPLWATAVIRVDAIVKGRVERGHADVLFASSVDVRWYMSPKIHRGEEAVFLARRGETDEAPPDAYTVIGPLSVQPRSALRQIKAWSASRN